VSAVTPEGVFLAISPMLKRFQTIMKALPLKIIKFNNIIGARLRYREDMDVDLLRIIMDWKIILILVVVIITLPLIFYFASLDKAAVRVKKIKMAPHETETKGDDDQQQKAEQSGREKRTTPYRRDRSVQSKEER
jgi:hypothetical protein